MKQRKPMSFDIGRSPRTPAEGAGKGQTVKERQQVGARIPTMLYRQLKARAALEGVDAQDLIEQAVRQFMADKGAKA